MLSTAPGTNEGLNVIVIHTMILNKQVTWLFVLVNQIDSNSEWNVGMQTLVVEFRNKT